MQKSIQIIFFLLGVSILTFAQEKNDCGCSLNLKEIITDIEHNYPGYKDKTKNENLRAYQAIKEKALRDAAKVLERENCFYVITTYLDFFKDNHIIFTDRKLSPKQVLLKDTGIKTNKKLVNQLTGTWRRRSDSLTIEIINESTSRNTLLYRAYILKSKDTAKIGYVHFDLIGNENEFRIRNYSGWLTNDLLRGRRLDQLLIEPNGIWEKIIPQANHHRKTTPLANNNKFNYQFLKNNTYYLGIPAFSTNEKKFDSLVVNEMIPAIVAKQAEHLIIDLRNNVGGNSSFFSLIRLIYEKPFTLPGDFVLSTPTMISKYQKSAEAGSSYYQKMLSKLTANVGGLVQRDSLSIAFKEVYQYPKTVSIIVNENCASSTEYFLILAKYSSKVKIYGRHTAGTLDYSELLQPEKLSCPGYTYMRPTTKSFWTATKPIDNKGIIPDVDLSKYPDDEWLDIVIKASNR